MRSLDLSSALGATLVFALIYAQAFFLGGFETDDLIDTGHSLYGYVVSTVVVFALVTLICMFTYFLEILLFKAISFKHKKRVGVVFYLLVGIVVGVSLSLFYLHFDEFSYFLKTATVLTTVGSILFYFIKTFVDSVALKKILALSPIVTIVVIYVLVR
ncbi:hypothetical protein [Domibacillus aminovorans]|uniref:Uncharacterized protein n=1 Tax=Domibacillus aminovorans TaxID=29332 RepID=A0A177L2J0_9BACI|nr:hypothetical protein [Domibacillus aminovorans]OAH59858.1 hypothetical protein AWH49_18210 [Domibacillus aminovorans]